MHQIKTKPPRTRLATLAVAALTLLAPTVSKAEELRGSATVYGWLPWIELDQTTQRGGQVETKLDAGDVLDSLKFAFMAAGELRYGRFSLLQDLVYSNLGAKGDTSGAINARVEADSKMLLWTSALAYQVYEQDGAAFGIFAGARYVDMKTDVSLRGGGPLGAGINASVDEDWWDPVVGVRGRLPIAENFALVGFADIGGFGAGSEFSGEFFAGLDYAINDMFSAQAGFRYIYIDYESSSADLEMRNYGPLLGLTARF